MSNNFDDAFRTIIGHEGGYVNDPRDPGGETKYGISKRAYPKEDIKNLTLARAKFLYERDYWNKVQGDYWPYPIAENLFDAAVNSGVKQAIKWLQLAVGSTPDGIIGPKTKAAAAAVHNEYLIAGRMLGYRLDFLNDMTKRWKTFGRGWAQRIANQLTRLGADTSQDGSGRRLAGEAVADEPADEAALTVVVIGDVYINQQPQQPLTLGDIEIT